MMATIPSRVPRPLIQFILPLTSVAAPCAATFFLKGYLTNHHQFGPLLSTAWLIAVCSAAWWWGYAGGLLMALAVIVSASLAATGHWISPQITVASAGVTFGIPLVVGWLAATRRKVEKALRLANEQLESKVAERTAELERARAAAEEQRAQLHSVFMQAPAIINIHRGPAHIVDLAHPLIGKLTGGRPIAGRPLLEAMPELAASGAVQVFDRVYETGVSETLIELPVHTPAGEAFFNLILNRLRAMDGSVEGLVVLAVDVTEHVVARREAEILQENLRETARLESIGVLAGGVAHDFNNLLVGIIGNASLALEILPSSSPARELLENLLSAGEKAALLTRQMLAYSGRGRFVIEPVDLSELTMGILPLISRSVPPKVVLRTLMGKHLPSIEADRSQLQQVIMNLVINAAEACFDRDGTVTVVTSASKKAPEPMFGLKPACPESGMVVLEVSDTGSGMSDETKAKIFDPFFTTKFTGRGLGLSAVLGIVRAHKGTVHVDTTPGKGTTFRVFFPASAHEEPEPVSDPAAKTPAMAGSGVVLVVDDEEIVRSTARAALEKYGYRVLLASNGEAAVEVFRDLRAEIETVVLDLTMPNMGGEETLVEMKRIDSDVRVILSTGYDESEATKRFAGHALAGFLQKPYTAVQLAQALKSVAEMRPSA